MKLTKYSEVRGLALLQPPSHGPTLAKNNCMQSSAKAAGIQSLAHKMRREPQDFTAKRVLPRSLANLMRCPIWALAVTVSRS